MGKLTIADIAKMTGAEMEARRDDVMAAWEAEMWPDAPAAAPAAQPAQQAQQAAPGLTMDDIRRMTPREADARRDEIAAVLKADQLARKNAPRQPLPPAGQLTFDDVRRMTPAEVNERRDEVFAILRQQGKNQ